MPSIKCVLTNRVQLVFYKLVKSLVLEIENAAIDNSRDFVAGKCEFFTDYDFAKLAGRAACKLNSLTGINGGSSVGVFAIERATLFNTFSRRKGGEGGGCLLGEAGTELPTAFRGGKIAGESGRVENRLSPTLPHQTMHAVLPRTAFFHAPSASQLP